MEEKRKNNNIRKEGKGLIKNLLNINDLKNS